MTSAVQVGEEEVWGGTDGHWWGSNAVEPAGLWKVHSQGCWGLCGTWTLPSGAAAMIQVGGPTLQCH